MNKKIYLTPSIETIEVETEGQFLATSPNIPTYPTLEIDPTPNNGGFGFDIFD